jgi:hypothetical protein
MPAKAGIDVSRQPVAIEDARDMDPSLRWGDEEGESVVGPWKRAYLPLIQI